MGRLQQPRRRPRRLRSPHAPTPHKSRCRRRQTPGTRLGAECAPLFRTADTLTPGALMTRAPASRATSADSSVDPLSTTMISCACPAADASTPRRHRRNPSASLRTGMMKERLTGAVTVATRRRRHPEPNRARVGSDRSPLRAPSRCPCQWPGSTGGGEGLSCAGWRNQLPRAVTTLPASVAWPPSRITIDRLVRLFRTIPASPGNLTPIDHGSWPSTTTVLCSISTCRELVTSMPSSAHECGFHTTLRVNDRAHDLGFCARTLQADRDSSKSSHERHSG